MKKLVSVLMVLVMVLSITAALSESAAAPKSEDEEYTFIYCTHNNVKVRPVSNPSGNAMISRDAYIGKGAVLRVLDTTPDGKYLIVETDWGTGCIPVDYASDVVKASKAEFEEQAKAHDNPLSRSNVAKKREADRIKAEQANKNKDDKPAPATEKPIESVVPSEVPTVEKPVYTETPVEP